MLCVYACNVPVRTRTKARVDGQVKKVYDKAQTPYQRTLASPHVSPEDKTRLTQLYGMLDPVALRQSIDCRLDDLWENYRVGSLNEATNTPKLGLYKEAIRAVDESAKIRYDSSGSRPNRSPRPVRSESKEA
jgi:hypothetical protein